MHELPEDTGLLPAMSVYPHIKLTCEPFPRILATRRPGEGAEYHGAYLPKTAVRILMDFLNRTFRLRSCDIAIDGSFEVPCTQYFAKRCVAPCVSSLCTRAAHDEIARLVELFLRNARDELQAELMAKVDLSAEALDFESAAFWRDMLRNVESYWSQPRWSVWLDDAVDTYEVLQGPSTLQIVLVTQRGRRSLGNLVFEFDPRHDPGVVLAALLRRFYKHHAPRIVRIPIDIPDRILIGSELSQKFGRPVRIDVVRPGRRTISARRALARSLEQSQLRLTAAADKRDLRAELQAAFGMTAEVQSVEAIDAAHISGTGFTAAAVVWANNEVKAGEFWVSDRDSELATLAAFVERRYGGSRSSAPDLVLIDGGRGQLTAARKGAEKIRSRPVFVAAVKPRARHSEISHFLLEDGTRLDFDAGSPAHGIMKQLRDEAHDLANSVHRLTRDMLHYYEDRGIKPLIVPIRFHEEGGNAADLRPIVTRK